jgi:hypothetical protein
MGTLPECVCGENTKTSPHRTKGQCLKDIQRFTKKQNRYEELQAWREVLQKP